ncbi:MAG: hypothetical protein IPL73_21125 [Candidatus Obscuribacter sp.]|nr:hypothetical protein [Candidatus Obscuribacter sp.]
MTPASPNQYFMQSARVGFRWWQADDLTAAMSLWGDPQVTRLFTKDPLTQEQVTQRLAAELKTHKSTTYNTGQSLVYLMILTLVAQGCAHMPLTH